MFIVRLLSWGNGSRINQYIFAVILSLPLFCFGMIQGWLSPMRKTLQSANGPSKEPYTIDQLSWAVSMTYVTAIITGAPLGYFIDKYGRKVMSLVTIVALIMYWAVKIISLEPEALIVARGIAGFPCSAAYIILPVYIKEISDKELRSALGTLITLVRNVGYLTSFILGDVLSWTWMLYVGISGPIVVFLLFLMLPETPEFLVQEGKIQEAKEVMAWLRGTTVHDSRLIQDLDLIVYREKQSNAEVVSPWHTIFHDRTTLKAFILTVFIKIAQQFDGYLVIILYASYVFELASETVDMNLTPNMQTVVVGTVQLIGSMCATLLVQKTGTKLLLIVTASLVGVGMLSLGSYFSFVDVSKPGWIPIVALCTAMFSDAAGFQPVSYLIISDMFNFHLRGQVSAATNVVAKMANFVQSKYFPDLIKLVGIQWVFMGFAGVCFTTSLVAFFFFPETRGRSLEEIYRDLSGKSKKEAFPSVQKGTP